MNIIATLTAWQETVGKHCNEQTTPSLLMALADILIEHEREESKAMQTRHNNHALMSCPCQVRY